MPTHIVIPDERAEQLRAYASSQKVTVAEAVGLLIKDAIAAGKIPNTIPGIIVERSGEDVSIDFGTFAKSFNRQYAKHLAQMLRWQTDPDGVANVGIALNSGVNVVRRGGGVKIVDPYAEGQPSKVLAPSVAKELAELIEAAAAPNAITQD